MYRDLDGDSITCLLLCKPLRACTNKFKLYALGYWCDFVLGCTILHNINCIIYDYIINSTDYIINSTDYIAVTINNKYTAGLFSNIVRIQKRCNIVFALPLLSWLVTDQFKSSSWAGSWVGFYNIIILFLVVNNGVKVANFVIKSIYGQMYARVHKVVSFQTAFLRFYL